MLVALLEKNSILWIRHVKSYCKSCVLWGWGICSLALRKSRRNSLFFHLYRFPMNRFQLTFLAVSLTTSIDWYNDFPKTIYFPICLVHPIFCASETGNHLSPAKWSPPKEIFLIILLSINFSRSLITCCSLHAVCRIDFWICILSEMHAREVNRLK